MENVNLIHIPRWEELPDFPLYIDQVVNYIETKLEPLSFTNEKIITSSMINNYVKHGIVSKPIKKKYTREQIAYFIVICILKQSFSLDEVTKLIQIQIKAAPLDRSYDYFCDAIEACIEGILTKKEIIYPNFLSTNPDIVYLLQTTVFSVTQKLCVQYYLYQNNMK